jgi:hypothetical protein
LKTVPWTQEDPPSVTILGGRWDGHRVLFVGPVAEYKDDRYVATMVDDRRVYMLESIYKHSRNVRNDR